MGPRLLAVPGLMLVVLGAGGCGAGAAERAAATPHPPAPRTAIHFARRTQEAGLRFRHSDGGTGRKYFVEIMGPGCGVLDYDGDGWPDIYLVNGGRLPGFEGLAPRSRLYRNNRDGTFADVTATAGVGGAGYGIGCCAGDYDNDGHTDLYVTGYGGNVLYHNNGDGTFSDVTAQEGARAGGFCSGAAFGDYDGDGKLDLYVCRYVDWDAARNVECRIPHGTARELVYCRPVVYPPAAGILFHNDEARQGKPRFRDVTAASGVSVEPGRSLGCLWTDVDDDARPDLFVANDMSENFLFHNEGGGRFRETAVSAGVAVGSGGQVRAGMGVCSADTDGDGRLDLLVTNFTGENTALFHNERGPGDPVLFREVSASAGLVEPTRPGTGFGIGCEDFDLDGWPDLFVANGHVTEAVEKFYEGIRLAQPDLVLRNEGGRVFTPVADPGEGVTAPRVHRGAAFADFNNDGRPDVLVSNWRDEPDLIFNDGQTGDHYLTLRLRGTTSNRDAIGARVTVTAGGRRQVREVRSGGSYCSQSDLRLFFGLGKDAEAAEVTVRWPGGGVETRHHLRADQEVVWSEGTRETPR